MEKLRKLNTAFQARKFIFIFMTITKQYTLMSLTMLTETQTMEKEDKEQQKKIVTLNL